VRFAEMSRNYTVQDLGGMEFCDASIDKQP
jgi:hypothetical protein